MKKIFHCGKIYTTLMTRKNGLNHMNNPCSSYHLHTSFSTVKFKCTLRTFTHCKFKNVLEGSHQQRFYAEEKAANRSPSLFSKYGTDVQFDAIQKFLEEEKTTPSVERWTELRQKVLSIEGGKVREDNVDGIILAKCVAHLDMAKSFVKFLNYKYKKITPQQIGQLLQSFYTNKEKCTSEDKAFIKKIFSHILKQQKTNLADKTVESLVAGISITDDWRLGTLLIDPTVTSQSSTIHIPLIEAAISHDDMDFAFQYLRKHLQATNSVPDDLLDYWIRHIVSRHKMDQFLEFLQESNLIMTKSTADLLAAQCSSHKDLYRCKFTSIDTRSRQCTNCGHTLSPLALDPREFDRLKQVFLDRTLVGQDVFQKTTPRELDKFLSFLDQTKPYDIVMDALNISHTRGSQKQADTLHKVVTHFLDRGANLLVLGRVHMLRWPHVTRLIRNRCQFFFVDNLSQDDPYLLYAAMHAGPNTRFVSRDLMRSHIYLLRDHSLRATFIKWQQLNQIVILSVQDRRLQVHARPAYGQHAQGGCQHWHVPYRELEVELTFSQVYKPKPTWLCLQQERGEVLERSER